MLRENPNLLAHLDIDVNQKSNDGYTPFYWACNNGKTSCVQLLLKDARVKVNGAANDGYTPLWRAACYGDLELIKWWIASGREMDLGQPGNVTNDAIGVAKKYGKTEVVSLLEIFKANPSQTRSEVRKELKITGEILLSSFFLFLTHSLTSFFLFFSQISLL